MNWIRNKTLDYIILQTASITVNDVGKIETLVVEFVSSVGKPMRKL